MPTRPYHLYCVRAQDVVVLYRRAVDAKQAQQPGEFELVSSADPVSVFHPLPGFFPSPGFLSAPIFLPLSSCPHPSELLHTASANGV